MYSVYVIYSAKLNRYYIGTTNNVERRLEEHNTGIYKNSFTGRGVPWELYLVIEDLESKQAYAIEAYLKRMKSSTYLKKLNEKPEVVEWLKSMFK
jgi:putative endonuclease